MAKCMKCGSKYRMNSNRIPTCKTCRYKERELDAFVKWEEKLEASMGPKPDYVTGGAQ